MSKELAWHVLGIDKSTQRLAEQRATEQNVDLGAWLSDAIAARCAPRAQPTASANEQQLLAILLEMVECVDKAAKLLGPPRQEPAILDAGTASIEAHEADVTSESAEAIDPAEKVEEDVPSYAELQVWLQKLDAKKAPPPQPRSLLPASAQKWMRRSA
jgi:hypothetical protein